MRTHRKHSPFLCWTNGAMLRRLVNPDSLIAARLEPITRGLRGGAGLDLTFTDGESCAIVPLIEIEPEMLAQREASPFIWPHVFAQHIAPETADAIEDLILPWIESHTLGRQLTGEIIRMYGDEQAQMFFNNARASRFLGAARYSGVIEAASPYAYAARYASGARIGICDANAGTGAALVARYARVVRADLGDEARNALARQWFGLDAFGALDGEYDVAIGHEPADATVRIFLTEEDGEGTAVDVATPIPTDVMFSFDPEDAAPVRRFRVTCAQPRTLRNAMPPTAPAATGGSSGRILLLLRNDWRGADDADADDAQTLARLLRAEGFSVDLHAAADRPNVGEYDLVHAFTLARAAEFLDVLRAAAGRGIPTVITAGLEDVCAEGAWGAAITRTVLTIARHETELEDHLDLLAGRRLEAPGLSPKHHEPFAGYETAVREALALAGALIATGPAEEAFLRTLGYGGPISHVPAYLQPPAGAEPVEEVVGTGDYALLHAPVEGRCNQFMAVRAAVACGLPLVLAGAITEPDYYQALREFANERVMFVPNPSEAQLSALYRSARVYVDVSWYRFGLARIARAAGAGCAFVISRAAYAASLWAPFEHQVDPASEHEIAVALNNAWMHASESPRRVADTCAAVLRGCDARTALTATVSAYANAQTRRLAQTS